VDLDALEQALRRAVLECGARVLEELLQDVGVGRRDEAVRCRCGALMHSTGVQAKDVLTLLGTIRFRRSRYRCAHCGRTRFPGDEELGVVGTSRSPGLQRQVARLGGKEPFGEVAKDLDALAGLRVSRKDAERLSERVGEAVEAWMAQQRRTLRFQAPPPPEAPKTIETLYIELDGTGVPMVPNEVAGRPGKQADGTAKTREAKLGCVFTQTRFDDDGAPLRDPQSTSFVGAIETAEDFGWRLYTEAVRRGLFEAQRVVVLGDGAAWVKNLASHHFGHAQFIIDFYHALEHVGDLCRALFDRDLRRITRYRTRWKERLKRGEIEALIDQATDLLGQASYPEDAQRHIHYFEKNKSHMRYGWFRAQGLFIGSGVIEAGCKHVIGQRLKQSGMEWTVRGANAIIALRCATLSNRFDDFWEQQAA